MTVLVIDDDPVIRRIVVSRLEHQGFQVDVRNSAVEALAGVAPPAPPPDLIICDVMMPGMDGYEFCRRVRALGIQAPFLFLTSKAGSDDKVRGLGVGADAYMPKPFDPRELDAKVAAMLRRR